MCFITLEDETGIANLVIWPDIFEKYRPVILSASMIAAKGRIQREGDVVHLVTLELTDLSGLLRQVGMRDDEDNRVGRDRTQINFRSRNFH
ncbi:OB-fold nucleic acid binding domain-containing protein [Gluconacetobacter sacchari]|uniref:OB-fold nucleic acid binding domain-containing protein n=1 Tax=Gluconacetobacter sacchari TaxID=92759 RepID=UPI0039B653E6